MCGIFGFVGENDNAANMVFEGLREIEYRGYDSWGVAFLEEGKLIVEKQIGFLPEGVHLQGANIALGHTRWATHGGVTEENAHPHLDCTGKLVLVHNGIVENYLELKETLEGHNFKSNTDTEVIVHLIEDQIKEGLELEAAAEKVFGILKGLNAFAVTDGEKVVVAKKGSPLVLGANGKGYFVASDPGAILPHTNKLVFLEDGQVATLNHQMKIKNTLNGQAVTPVYVEVGWVHKAADKGEFDHFMLKEIHEQPRVLFDLAQNMEELAGVVEMVKEKEVFVVGCGTSAHAGIVGQYLLSKISKKRVNFITGAEFPYIQDFINSKSLVLAISQSGESIDVVEPVGGAKRVGANVVSIVNVMGSTLYRMSDVPVLMRAGVEKGVASTKAFTATVGRMIGLSYGLAGKFEEAKEIVLKSAQETEKVLEKKDEIYEIAKSLKDARHIYVMGRGLSYPVAMEAALKIKEVSYIHTEGFAGGELKHGPIALIDKGTPVIVFVPNDETREAVLANAMEVKARGARVIGIGPENNTAFNVWIEVADTGASSVIPHTVVSQLLAYDLAVLLGKNPDKPRNLAKSVVVR